MTDTEIKKACGEMCSDNRFQLIEKYKKHLIEHTNIETAKDEVAVLDSLLFRCWQMGWLDKLEDYNRQQAEIERLQKLQKPTETSGFRIENGKVVFYSDMLNGYRHEFKDLDEIVKELNLYMQTDYKNIELISHYKHKAQKAKADAIKEFAERLKRQCAFVVGEEYWEVLNEIDNLVKEMVGEDK